MKRFLVVLTLLISSAVFCFSSDDSFWEKRNTEVGAKASYEYYKSQFNSEQNYENAWKFARAAHFYADNFIKDSDSKKTVFTEGKKAAEAATNQGYDKPDGHYYLGICLGSWAEANGILKSLFTAGDILKEASKVINIDPAYENGSGYMLRARVYQKAPGGISVGDSKKADADYQKAIEYGPSNRVTFRFYAELLMDKDKTKAKDIIEKGLAIPINENDSLTENKEIDLLKDLQKKVLK